MENTKTMKTLEEIKRHLDLAKYHYSVDEFHAASNHISHVTGIIHGLEFVDQRMSKSAQNCFTLYVQKNKIPIAGAVLS